MQVWPDAVLQWGVSVHCCHCCCCCCPRCRQDTWRALEVAFNSGKARAIGVANFEQRQVQDILDLNVRACPVCLWPLVVKGQLLGCVCVCLRDGSNAHGAIERVRVAVCACVQSLTPAVNQIEFHPYWHEDSLRDWCAANNITMNGYAPLGAPDVRDGVVPRCY